MKSSLIKYFWTPVFIGVTKYWAFYEAVIIKWHATCFYIMQRKKISIIKIIERRDKMANQDNNERRSKLGYGSTYRKGNDKEQTQSEIKTVLGGQVWMVKPDKSARTS